jgi:hypothetical protein
MRIVFYGVALMSLLSTSLFAQPQVKKPACDRACLQGYMDRYLKAMLDRNVSDELFARNVRFTENGIQLPLGNEGLWYGMSGLGGYRFYVPDIETQQIALIGSVKENMGNRGVNDDQGNNVAVAIRLKIVDAKITEVEQLAIRPAVQLGGRGGGGRGAAGGAGAGARGAAPGAPAAAGAGGRGAGATGGDAPGTGDRVAAMKEPHPIYFQVIPENERASREELVTQANYYFTALARHDSKGYYPFTEGCVRFENGITATSDCLAQFTGSSLNNIVDRIRDRRFVAVDRERGIVFSFAFFDHYRINWTWQLAELFKIEKGKIRRIEAVFHQAPFGIPSGWSTHEQSISEEIQSIR